LMVRRERVQLLETIERSRQIYGPIGARYNDQDKMWRWPNGARLRFAGFYARAFIHRQSAAYVGYSETISYGLHEGVDNCLTTSHCLSEKQIAVRSLPLFGSADKGAGVGWVDALAIDRKLSGVRKDLALEFMKLATSDSIYQSMLQPEWPYRSRYLLPARRSIRIDDAPLYAEFLPAQSGRGTGTLLHLNAKLREIAGRVTCALPIDRDDMVAKNACKN